MHRASSNTTKQTRRQDKIQL